MGEGNGCGVGEREKAADGIGDGLDVVGKMDGECVGTKLGTRDGVSDGISDGDCVGVAATVGDAVRGNPRVVFTGWDHWLLLSHSQQHCVQHGHSISSQSAINLIKSRRVQI